MSFLAEIKRRKLFQVAAVYGITAWLLVQIVATIESPLNLPDWFDTAVIVLVAVGFPVTLIVSWAFNVSSEGLVRDEGAERTRQGGGRTLEYVLIGLLVVAVGWLFYRDVRPSGDAPRASEVAESNETAAAAREPLTNSIAVLVCDNLSPDEDNYYFAASLHEEVLNQLVKLQSLNVIARTSVLPYVESKPPIAQIARDLNVLSILECSVAYADGRVAVSAQLIDPETGVHLWSERYNRAFENIFDIQADIAMNIANALNAEFTPAEQRRLERRPTTSPEAYAFLLRARQAYRNGDSDRALRELAEAIRLDPEYAEAYVVRSAIDLAIAANVWTLSEPPYDPEEALARAREDVNRALAIDPDLDAGHSMLAFVEDLAGNDAAADESIARSLRINPNYHYPIMLRVGRLVANGRRDEALAVLERMAEIDPNNFDTLGGLFSLAGDLETSREYYALYTDFAPADVMGHVRLGRIEWILGDIEAAARELRLAETLLGDPPSSAMDAAYLSNSYRLIGLADDGARMAGRLDRATIEALPPWVHVQALLGAGDVERAYALASTMVARRAPLGLSDAFVFAINAYRDPVLEQPRFVALRRRLGYEE